MEYDKIKETKPVCRCLKCNKLFLVEDIKTDENGHKASPCCGSEFKIYPSRLDLFLNKYLYVNDDPKYYEY